jgi:hypothetical protein
MSADWMLVWDTVWVNAASGRSTAIKISFGRDMGHLVMVFGIIRIRARHILCHAGYATQVTPENRRGLPTHSGS